MANTASPTIRIIRMGNGKARAVPSPKELSPGTAFTIKNWTECEASVDFTDVPVTPKKQDIEPGEYSTFSVDESASDGYYEYEVSLQCDAHLRPVRQYVEGGSRPGLIIDR